MHALEFTFVMLQEELVFMKLLQDQTHNVMMLLHGFSVDEDVVEIHTVRATPSNIPKQASCGLYKNSGLGEMRLMG